MAKGPTTFGLNPEKLRRILNICADDDSADQNEKEADINQQRTEILQDRLAETLLSGSLRKSPLRKELNQLCQMSGLAAGESIRNLLQNPDTDIKVLKKIKQNCKNLSKNTQNKIEHDTANAIYYAAIAHALIYHNTKITKFSYEQLEKSLSLFAKTKWVSTDLTKLFDDAARYCQGKL